MFNSIVAKLGNMRKEQEWTVYPSSPENTKRTIQCDSRIAEIDLTTGLCVLSDGKGGHPGFLKLSKFLGAKVFPVPDEIIEALK